MRAVVIFESMYGNTHDVAVAIADGLAGSCEVTVADLAHARSAIGSDTELLVVGGPTHVHGMSKPQSRKAAVADADKHHLTLDRSAPGPGLREWLSVEDLSLPESAFYAAFDTRVDMSPVLSGRAAPRIAKLLRRQGLHQLLAPESFLVNRENHLLPDELERARAWGAELARRLGHGEPQPG